MVRAGTLVQNWQAKLRLLVNDPRLVHSSDREFTPIESPLSWHVPLAMSDSLHTALLNRLDISRAIRDVRTAAVELGVAQKDVLPTLDVIASTYVAGLADESDAGRAFGGQFSEGRPTYSVGLRFELPIGNRAAYAQTERRQWEMKKAMDRYRLTVEEALTSVEIAVREVDTVYREMVAKDQAMRAAENEALYLDDRWRVLPGVDDSAAQLLENLLDAQERVADQEAALVRAQVNYAMALVRLKAEMGTLLSLRGDDPNSGRLCHGQKLAK
jgi:outer membrane protein TolC